MIQNIKPYAGLEGCYALRLRVVLALPFCNALLFPVPSLPSGPVGLGTSIFAMSMTPCLAVAVLLRLLLRLLSCL